MARELTPLTARRLLSVRTLWAAPVVLAVVTVSLMSLVYLGSLVDPAAHLHGLPVLLVNQDRGGDGDAVERALVHSGVARSSLAITVVELAEAHDRMDDGQAYATIVLPRELGRSSARGAPSVRVLTNLRAGSVGVGLATGALDPVLIRAVALATSSTPSRVHVVTEPYRPLPSNSALGLSAFYLALLATMCGFLGATIVNSTIDSATGYATTETGPRWSQRMPVPMTRWQTLLAKWGMALVMVPILTGLTIAIAALVGLTVPANGWTWLFMSFAAITVAFGTLALLAVFGGLGQLLALLFFVYLAMAASGATIPRQALPTFFRWVSEIDPLRRTLDGVRAILYFDGSMDAGLRNGIAATALGLLLWLAIGASVTKWYDRKGMERLPPDVLGRISVAATEAENEETTVEERDGLRQSRSAAARRAGR